ncbi:uncharacterized protein LOC118560394 [Fundulus heteroclitus]|uniref:uncharacterized protein LOC118560394 n=1 Tax=Fundulus heteroclitus TaxID=8078 RepID=UPI00165B8435|nr:uncharacterized protein LOC118560394 [Fundulus heteroclitus]
MIVQVVRNPHGGVKRKADKTLDSELIRKKRQHLYIVANRSDQLCFSISLAHMCNPAFTDAQAVQQAVLWQRTVGLTEQTPVTFSDVQKFEKIVNRKIIVFYKDGKNAMLRKFQTDFSDRSNPLFLLLFKNHYYGIKNLAGFTGSNYICSYCFTGFQNINRHNCEGHCSVCLDPKCTLQQYNSVQCIDCNRICHNSFCLDRHKVPRLRPNLGKHVSNCETTKFCPVCKKLYDLAVSGDSKPHECSMKCTVCRQKLPSGVDVTLNEHQCYIQPTLTDPELGNKLFFYDFETFTDQTGRHIPFLVYTKTLAGDVWYSYGLNCVRDFLLHFRKPCYKGFTFLAHNSRGFDSYLVLSVMVELGIKPYLITQGSKILCFTEPDYALKFIDSLSFLTMKLRQMPKALGFTDHSKGFFPHLFSSEKTLSYVGPLPPPCFYAIDRMNPAEQERFYIWYNEACKHPFDSQKEALYYCQNYVEILFKACVKFREEFFKETTGKQEASGFPAEATDEESRLKYVADYKLNQGIQLDVRKIEVNPAKRQVAKLCKYVVCYFHFLNDDMCMIQWKYNKRCISPPNKRKTQTQETVGWTSFMATLKELNIPVSSVSNPQAREQYRGMAETGVSEKNGAKPFAKQKGKIVLSPKFSGIDFEHPTPYNERVKSQRVKNPAWLKFSP